MKKNYIYIILGILCFLGFNMEAKADYKPICKYNYSGTYNSNSTDRKIIDAELLYDKDKNEPFKMIITLTAENLEYNDEEDNLSVSDTKDYYFKAIDAQSNVSADFGTKVYYSYENLNSSICPKNLIINGAESVFCFYNTSSGDKWCQEKMLKHSKNYNFFEGTAIETETYSNIKEGDTCTKAVGTDGDTGEEFAYLSFKYINGGLEVQYKTSEDGEPKIVTDNIIKIEYKDPTLSGNSEKSHADVRKIYLTNANADLHTYEVVLKTRSDFDRAYLKEWNETGACPVLTTDPDGHGSNYWLLLPDAVADAKKYGSSKVDVEDFVELRDWEYDWRDWFSTSSDYDNCEGLLGEEIIGIIEEILLYVRILIPVALIGFGIADFVRAVFSSKEDEMKKAQVRFIKRLVMAAIVFIIPSLVNLLLNTIDGIWAHVNNSACNIWD